MNNEHQQEMHSESHPKRKKAIFIGIGVVVAVAAVCWLFSSVQFVAMTIIISRQNDSVIYRSLNPDKDSNAAQYCLDTGDIEKGAIIGRDLTGQRPAFLKGYLILAEAYNMSGNIEQGLKTIDLGISNMDRQKPEELVATYALEMEMLKKQQLYTGKDNTAAIADSGKKALDVVKAQTLGYGGSETQLATIRENLFDALLYGGNTSDAETVLAQEKQAVTQWLGIPRMEQALKWAKSGSVDAGELKAVGRDDAKLLSEAVEIDTMVQNGNATQAGEKLKALLDANPKVMNEPVLKTVIAKTGLNVTPYQSKLKAEYDAMNSKKLLKEFR